MYARACARARPRPAFCHPAKATGTGPGSQVLPGPLSLRPAQPRSRRHGPERPTFRTKADFAIHGPEAHGIANFVGLYGIESPRLTSSLAIAGIMAALLA